MLNIALLDDFQNAALTSADWSPLAGRARITPFHDHVMDETVLAARLAEFDVISLMRERTPFRRSLIERLPRLKLLVTTGAANTRIDLDAAAKCGVTVCGTESNNDTTPELAWALIMALVRKIPAEDRAIRAGGWQTSLGVRLKGRTLGILGLGRVGGRIAEIGQVFGMAVIAWSQNLTEEAAAAKCARLVTKSQLFSESDVLSVHLQLSPRTVGMVGRAELAQMKPTAYFVNTARGQIVDERALVEALAENRIAGAALDVYEQEPLPAGHPLTRLDNVVLTPHLGYVTEESYQLYYRQTVEGICAWLDGKPIRVIAVSR